MKRNSFTMVAFGFATIALLSQMLNQSAVAAAQGKDVSKEISELRNSTSSGELYLAGRDLILHRALDEIDVARTKCRYVATSATDLDSLIDVLVNAQLFQVQDNKDGYDARIVIRLYQGEGDKRPYTLVLSPDYSNANAQGEFYRRDQNGAVSTIPIEAKTGIERDLRFWAAQHRFLAPKGCGE